METQRVVRLEIDSDGLVKGANDGDSEIQKKCCLAFPLGLQMAWC
jgi:hypothetical protein